MDKAIIEKFMSFFTGDEYNINRYSPPELQTEIGKKEEGRTWAETTQVNPAIYEDHLTGKLGLGVCPVTREGKLKFAVIDIDIYPPDFHTYQNVINKYELPFIIFKSKSGGAHLFIFFKSFIGAKKVREVLKVYKAIFGFTGKAEIFPKQDILINTGSKINLPYFGDSRKALDADLTELSIDDALNLISTKLQTLGQVETQLSNLPLYDAPICLQSLFITENITGRELYLFNMAIFLKNKYPDSWQTYIERANDKLQEPLQYKELQTQVITSNEKNTYSYKCGDMPLCDRCDKKICYERKYGKNSEEISNFSFEKLTQFLTDPPYYEWVVNGVVMKFFTEKDMVNQDEFIYQCIRFIHLAPNKLKRDKWMLTLNNALAQMEVVQIDISDRLDPGSILAAHFYEYVMQGAKAASKEQFATMQRVFLDKEKGVYYFKRDKLFDFITIKKAFKYFTPVELGDKLKKLGAEPDKKLWINAQISSVRAWCITADNLLKLGDKISLPSEALNFDEFKPGNNF